MELTPRLNSRDSAAISRFCDNHSMGTLENSPALLALAIGWARDSMRSRGLRKSLIHLCKEAWYLLRDSTPERRRSRFGDIDYDCDYGMDTTWARLSWRVRLREVFTERLYQPTVPEEFAEIMQHLARVDFTKYTFIDLGSGKGRALLLAAEYPFRSIIGVEVQPELHAIAEENIRRLHETKPGVDIHSLCLDGRLYKFPPDPLVIYMFNPFPDYVLSTVVQNLRQSLAAQPRPVYVVYNAPFEQHIVDAAEFLHRRAQTSQYAIYYSANLHQHRGGGKPEICE